MSRRTTSFPSFLSLLAGLTVLVLSLPSETWCSPPSSVIFHAPFDGSLEAEGAHGVVKPQSIEGKVEYRPGKSGQALLCGGDGAFVKYPVVGNIRPHEGTITMWVCPVDWPEKEEAFHIFFETQGPGWLVLYKFWNSGFLMLSGIDQAHYSSAFDTAFSLKNNEWHQLAGVWKYNRLEFYVDGVLKKKFNTPSLPQSFAGVFNLGDACWSKPHDSHTLIDDVTIYRYALPPDQIALAAQGKPVTYQPKVNIEVLPRPTLGLWKINVDASGYVGEDGPGTHAKVEILCNGKVIRSRPLTNFEDGVASTETNVSKIPAGPLVIRATILDSTEKDVIITDAAFEKPVDPSWWKEKPGMDDRVLPPFTRLLVGSTQTGTKNKPSKDLVECWGRTYTMNGPFPTQIKSIGKNLLAAPVHLTAVNEVGELKFQKDLGEITSGSSTRAHHSGSVESDTLRVTTKSTIEYDGFLWTDVTLTPTKTTTLTSLTLNIPVKSNYAIYLHRASCDWSGGDDAGLLPAKGYETAAFRPFLWVGDDDRGLSWFAEDQKNWSNAPGKPFQRVMDRGSFVEMQIDLINQPTKIDHPLQFSFGLQATPVKLRPTKAKSWRLGNLGTSDNLKDPSMGNLQVIWCNGNLAYYGYPQPQDPEKFRKLVADLHAKKVLAIPYINLNFLSAGAPEFAYYGTDWRDSGRSFSDGDVGAMGYPTIGACPRIPAWHDFIAYKIAKFVDEYQVDGIYIDCWNPINCVAEDHGCGWHDAAGNLRGTVPLRGYREIVRRVRGIFAGKRPDFHIIIHMSCDVTIPMLAFADSMLDGEQYQVTTKDPKDDYLNIVPLDKWRAENTGLQWGLYPFFLPEFAGENRINTLATDRLMGIMLAHGTSPWPIWCKASVIFDAWKTVDKYGYQTSEFRPYWKSNGLATDNRDVLVSAYYSPGIALLVVLNSGKTDAQVTVKIDTKSLGFQPISAKMASDESPILLTDNAFHLAIPGRGYRLVVLQ